MTTDRTPTTDNYVAMYEVEKKLGDEYRHAAVRLRVALGSIRSLKLPDWLGAEVESAWAATAFLVDIDVRAEPRAEGLDALREAASTMRVSVADIRAAIAHLRGPMDRDEAIVIGCADALALALDRLAALAPEPETPGWDWFEYQAVRAALHEVAGRCRDGRFEHCYDTYHQPPVNFSEWWPLAPEPDRTGQPS